ncbi:MAG: Mut7-C RNAse domain-containing protein [Thermodesulfobacteriota bacterium]
MELCFAADKTLGRLAKWLRLLGFDTLYEPGFQAEDSSGLEPNRILLTRGAPDRRNRRDNPCIVIRSDHYRDQLAEVVRALGLTSASIRPFSRCIRCNSAIMPAGKEGLQGKVPDYIWETHDAFKICQGCQRIYWPGSHIERSLERIGCLFNG